MIINACRGQPICLGYETENEVEAVVFDKSAWIAEYGSGTFELVHKRRQDTEPLPVAVDVSGGVVTWTITAADVAYRGAGEAQLRYYNALGQIKASEVYRTQVARSLVTDPDTPEPYEGWLERILATAAAAQLAESGAIDARDAAEAAAEAAAGYAHEADQIADAAQAAQAAAESAQREAEAAAAAAAVDAQAAHDAAKNMSFASFTISPEGYLLILHAENLGTTNFALTSAGHLEVTI